jgi:outer membrane protein insertion porin family
MTGIFSFVYGSIRGKGLLKAFFVPIALIFSISIAKAQDSTMKSVDPKLLEIYNSRFPKPYTIAGITVTGVKSFDPNLIISISGMAVGDVIQLPGSDIFSKAIQKLWKQNLISFAQINLVKLADKDLYIEIEMVERPRLLDFSFTGIKKGEKEDISGKTGLSKDRVLTENMKLNAVEQIRKFYYEKGFRNVDVSVVELPSTEYSNAINLNFRINKGKKVRVNALNFTGNVEIPDAKLKKQFKGTKEMTRITLFPEPFISPYGDSVTKPSVDRYLKNAGYLQPTRTRDLLDPYFRFKLFSSSKFNEKKYQEDKERLLEYFNERGFRDAMLIADTQFYNNKGNLNIDIKLTEGRRYYFGNISWKGNSKYNPEFLNMLLGIKKGDVYNLETLNKRLGKALTAEGGDISSLYMDDGYLFFRIDAVETAVYNDTIDFEIRMMEGPQATYGRITVSGNNKTKDYVVLRELRTLPGDKFSRSDIIRTQRELSQLGFFNPEKISPNVVPNAETGTVDINWEVEEKSSDQLELSAGFGGGIGLTGTLGVSFNNFSIKNIFQKSTWDPLPTGDGQKLSLRVQSNGKAYRAYNFSFTEPWLGGKKRNSFSVSYYNTKFARTFDNFGNFCRKCGDSSYVKTIGFGLSLGKRLRWPDDYFNLIYALNYQQYNLRNYPNIFQGINTGTSNNINLRITLMRSSAGPNPIFPTSGSDFSFSGQFTLPYSVMGIKSKSDNDYSLAEYHKWRFNGEWYVPIGRPRGPERNKQFIFKAAAKYGFIGRYSSDKKISPFERFQVGDAGLSNTQALLGFDIIAHRGYPIYSSSDPKINPEGITPAEFFTIFNKYSFELRYPFSTAASSTIFGLGFFEAANGWYDFKNYNPFRLRRSVGLGVRFFLPMFGLLGFDYGIGLDRYNQETGIKGAAKFTFMLGREPE